MKKFIFILSLVLSFNAYALSDCAQNEDNCWDCAASQNDSCIARLKDGILTISGSGTTKSYEDGKNPWRNREDIKEVIVEEGITILGGNSFEDVLMSSISLPSTLERINYESFQGTLNLKTIVIPNSVTYMGSFMFDSTGLKSIVLGDSLDFVGQVFCSSDITIYCQESDKRTKTCEQLIEEKNPENLPKLKTYYTNGNGEIVFGKKTYASLEDLAKGKHIPKRIYTIEEANFVAGKKNRVSIKYR